VVDNKANGAANAIQSYISSTEDANTLHSTWRSRWI